MPLYIEKCWLLSDNHHYQTEFSPSISIILHNNFGHLTQKKQRIFDRNRDYCNDGTLSNTPFWNDRHKTNEKFTNWSPVNKSTQIRWSSHTSTNWCVIWFFRILLLFGMESCLWLHGKFYKNEIIQISIFTELRSN